MTEPGVESCWRCVLMLKEAARATPDADGFGLRFGPEVDTEVLADALPTPRVGCHRAWIALGEREAPDEEAAWLRVEPWVGLEVVRAGTLPDQAVGLLRSYGAYALLPTLARSLGRAVAVSHFAQSLDGRIATANGDSRWIGDEANQVHAHRMRALCDAILVGAQTVRRDQPRLNVRHVEGRDPVRVVLGRSGPGLTAELEQMRVSSDAPVLCVVPSGGGHVGDVVEVPARGDRAAPRAVLEALWARGLASVYIEGGQQTTSGFLASEALDIVQVHVAPLILGAGPVGFALGEGGATDVARAVRFEARRFEVAGDGVLFVGWRNG